MVSIRNVEGVDFFRECSCELQTCVGVVYDPGNGLDTVVGREVIDRVMLGLPLINNGTDVLMLPVGEEDGPGVGVAALDVVDAVLLLVVAGLLVF